MKKTLFALLLILPVSISFAEPTAGPHTTLTAPDDSRREINVAERAVGLPSKDKKRKADEVSALLSPFSGEWVLVFGKPKEEEKEATKNLLIQRNIKKSDSVFEADQAGISFHSIDPTTRKTKIGYLPILKMEDCTGNDHEGGFVATDIYIKKHLACWIDELRDGKASKVVVLSTWESGPMGWRKAGPPDKHSADESTLEIDSDGKLRVTHRTFDYVQRKFTTKQLVYERR